MASIKADGVEYEVVAGTLGELRTVKRIFGVVPSSMKDATDPDVIGAVLFIAMKRANAAPNDDAIVALIDSTRNVELIADESDADPTKAADEAASENDATGSSPVTTPAPSGELSTPASTE